MEEHLKRFATVSNEVSKGNYGEIEQIFELTRSSEYPSYIAELAESFGMMIVKIEAREIQLEGVIEDLRQKKKQLEKTASELAKANMSVLEVLGNAIAKRDSDTNAHNYRVTLYSIGIAEKVGLNPAGIRSLIKGSSLHDVGKIGIPDSILLKPGKLTAEEYEIMKTHISHGADIIQGHEWLKDSIDVVIMHHEKYDGSGYMQGLKGEEIPVNARIFCIADVFDALTSRRPYKAPLPLEKVMAMLKEGRGSHFDPLLLDTFFDIAEQQYASVYKAGEKELKEELDRLVTSYFEFRNNNSEGGSECID